MKVTFCEKNEWKDSVITMLSETHPDIKISTKKCLGKCHRCKSHPIARVNKKVLVGTDEKDLYNVILRKLQST